MEMGLTKKVENYETAIVCNNEEETQKKKTF